MNKFDSDLRQLFVYCRRAAQFSYGAEVVRKL